jgi:hypothetical protein
MSGINYIPADLAAAVDEIGLLKAQIAPLEAKLKAAQAKLKAAGDGRYEGTLWAATVFSGQRETLDMDAVRAKLTHQFITAHTRITETVTVKVTARKTEA